MTIKEARNSKGYLEAMTKIIKYRPGFKFTVDYDLIRRVGGVAKLNGMHLLLKDAQEVGLIDSISMDLNLLGECTAETFRRTEVWG